MDELFFGLKRKTHKRRSPMRKRRSPIRRRTVRCTKALSLPKLRKLALENGINIYSEARTAISKRTGMPKKPKMVGCSTLKKRFDEAGLGNLYRVREMMQMEGPEGPEGPGDLFEEEGPVDPVSPMMVPTQIPQSVLIQADPACDSAFQELARKQPNNRSIAKFLKQYKGYALGQGPCDKRDLVPTHIHGDEDDLESYANEAGFDMSFGRRYMAGARPRMHYKHAGEIVVRGRVHQVFKGKDGGLFYLKGKTGHKIYVDKKRLKKKSPKRSRRTRFGAYDDEDEEEMEFGRRYMAGARPRMHYKHAGEIVVRGRVHQVFKGKDGGLFYLKGKTGHKIYVDKKRLKKKSPKRSRRTRFGMDEDDDEEEMEFGARKAVAYIMVNNRKRTLYRGMKGGLYYVKNNRKVYVNPSAVRHRRSPLRRRR
jgi:hypothetical protein